MRCDCFFRAWHRDQARMFSDRNVRVVLVEAPADATIDVILGLALDAGASKGNGRTGIFQVQTDIGIWTTIDGRPFVTTSPGKRAMIAHQTWAELEAEELGARSFSLGVI